MKTKYWIVSLLIILPLLMIACVKDTGVQPTKPKNLNSYIYDPYLIPTIPPLDCSEKNSHSSDKKTKP